MEDGLIKRLNWVSLSEKARTKLIESAQKKEELGATVEYFDDDYPRITWPEGVTLKKRKADLLPGRLFNTRPRNFRNVKRILRDEE